MLGRMQRLGGVGLLVTVWCLPVLAGEALDPWPRRITPTHDTDFVPSTEFVTPYIPYAKPYAFGTTRALFIVWAPTARHVVELYQRMDLQFSYVGVGPHNLLWRASSTNPAGPLKDDILARARALLKMSHDVIVLGRVRWSDCSEDMRAEILRQVENGTGLVISFRREAVPTREEGRVYELYQQATETTSYFPGGRARATTCGKGRVAFVPYEVVFRYDDFYSDFTGYEERDAEEFARTLLWAAGKEPRVEIGPINILPEPGGMDRDVSVSLKNTAEPVAGVLCLDVRRDLAAQYPLLYGAMFYQLRPYASWEDVHRVQVAVTLPANGQQGVNLRIPALPAGQYSFDFSLRDEQGRVVSWRKLPVEIQGEARVGAILVSKPEVAPVKADETVPPIWFSADDKLRVQVRAQGHGIEGIRLILCERDGRVLGQETQPATAQEGEAEAQFEISLQRAIRRLAIARVELLAGERVLAEKRVPIFLRERLERAPVFRQRMMGCALLRPDLTTESISYFPGYNVPLATSTVLYAWHDIAHLNVWNPEIITIPDISPDYVRNPSLSDPTYLEKEAKGVEARLADTAQPGHPGRDLIICDDFMGGFAGKEGKNRRIEWPHTAVHDRSPHAQTAFREYLRKQYGDLVQLNRSWGSNYQTWEAVETPLYDPDPAKAPPETDWPRVVDHRLFVNQTYVDYLKPLAEAARRLNPANALTPSAIYTFGMWTCLDYYQWAKVGPRPVLYYDPHIWRSFTPERVAVWRCYQGLSDSAAEQHRAWQSLCREVENVHWSREWPVFRPDFTLNPAPAAYFAAMREIRESGIANLLLRTENRRHIGVLYHPASACVFELNDWQARGLDYYRNVYRRKKYVNFTGRYLEGGLSEWAWRYVHTDQFIRNDFGQYSPPALVYLPLIEVLSAEEAEALRRYVREGGILVADLNVGVRDAHGKRLPQGILDDVFGIRRTGYQPPIHDPPIVFRHVLDEQQAIDAPLPAFRANNAPRVPGRHGKGMYFSGRTHFIHVSHSPDLEPAQLTLAAWVMIPQEATANGWVVSKNGGPETAGFYGLGLRGGKVGAVLNIGGGKDNAHAAWSTGSPIAPGKWHHVAMTYDGAELKAYCDGIRVAGLVVGKPRVPHDGLLDPKNMYTAYETQNVKPNSLVLGRRQDGREYFEGTLDEVCLYDRALPPAAVANLAEKPLPGSVAWWSFEENAGIVVRDGSGRGHDGVFCTHNVVPPAPKYLIRFADGGESRTPLTGGATIEPAGAKAMAIIALEEGHAPAFLVHDYGRGRAIYLNFAAWDDAAFDRIRAMAGLQPDWRLDAGNPAVVDFVRDYHRGSHLYLVAVGTVEACWPWSDPRVIRAMQEQPAVVTLAAPRHVYDVRRGKYLGLTNLIKAHISREQMAQVFACLPYRVEAVSVSGMKAKYAPGDIVAFQARLVPPVATDQAHTLRTQVFAPTGSEVAAYGCCVETRNGVATGQIPLALNESRGTWRLVVSDVATGVRGEAQFVVQ